MKDNEEIKICVVCGDVAIARNFGALTCKSCKPFFRRNANKYNLFNCKNGGLCDININTRKRCRKCRLDKCFAVGMKKEMILDDVERHFRRCLVEENRKKRRNGSKVRAFSESDESQYGSISEASLLFTSLESNSLEPNENEIKVNLDSSFSFDPLFSEENKNENQIPNNSEKQIISEKNFTELYSDINENNQDSHFNSLTIARPFNNFDKCFTPLEEYKLSELLRVFRPVVNSWNKTCILFDIKDVTEMVKTANYFYEREINNFVKAIKELGVFESLCEDDKIALVKYSCIDVLCLRAIQCYDSNKDSWIVTVDQDHALALGLKLFKALKCDIYFVYKNYLLDIIKECDSDSVILDLLSAMALFSPNRPNLINSHLIELEQRVCLYLLQRYLSFKYRTKYDSEFKFMKLLNTLKNAHFLGQLEKKYFIGDYQEQYSPLIQEIINS